MFNAEFRFPLVRSLTLGFLPVGFPPIEAAIFYDAGLAWNANSDGAPQPPRRTPTSRWTAGR